MKLPSNLAKSRHGVFYFRLFGPAIQGVRKESRISLQTKNPTIAKEKSRLISAIMVKNKIADFMDDEQDILKRIHTLTQKELETIALKTYELNFRPRSSVPTLARITLR
ncbi:hypothetical protein LPB67_02025 [Undibacterium sp. Jales W-56]|uniref:hypothetical protein n=1 Tax=Undibacterium sp. Jales W-56 TaxID=2897325 RepID=UPI0021D04473|nr:hypothetical protein [Undibacterium sp. Jales W-56]MCU6432555.1 hypothetical protein [Undibacterium sp. Jales W-56]